MINGKNYISDFVRTEDERAPVQVLSGANKNLYSNWNGLDLKT